MRGELMASMHEDPAAQIVQIFDVGLPDFAQEQAFYSGHALAVVSTHLGEQPVGFPAAARPAIANSSWTTLHVTGARRR